MVDTRALRAREGKIFVRVRVSPSAPTGCGLVGKAPRLGRGDPRFESGHPDFSTSSKYLTLNREKP
jgi:hypothetical protein